MADNSIPLSTIFAGWDGYNTSLLHAIQPLTQAQLLWRPADHLRSVGELALMLGMQGIDLPELGGQGGHITMPPLALE